MSIINQVRFSLIIILINIFTFSCATHQMASSYTSWDDSVNENSKEVRKIIFSASISLSVKNLDTTNVYLQKIAKKYEGYAQEVGTYSTTLRVKSTSLEQAIREIEELGKVKSKQITGTDVTEDFLDCTIRLENAEKSRQRYLQLLEKAEDVQGMLLIEKELERLNGTIEKLKGKINRINHLSDYSTITIKLYKKEKLGILGYAFAGVYYTIKWLFVR